ncbi:hypothetical protein [Longimicrobium terrae]|uniref:Uncharacterized protein n=1 Tax=Longimicrobium terrae TaxID=1639882 RepID=A0A841H1P1_9BACT|nr:hypothetical protein [Longimicrobium terrae]MBB4637490.1 hypothetical protein [Longimicrobium terrae]MBB6071888.1 hypothetical protein [Longimicrobium terrae]NNC30436.1 hypothetical protein [Longimicrobium terrae]
MTEPHLFTLIRRIDETGVSGTGRILDGVVFHTGQVVVCWRTDESETQPGFSSLGVYPSWEAFHHVHVAPHPAGSAEIEFLTGTPPALPAGLVAFPHTSSPPDTGPEGTEV